MPFCVEGYDNINDFEAVVEYMKTEFPLDEVCTWLCLNKPPSGDTMLATREFSLQARGRDFVYTKRYISGKTPAEVLGLIGGHKLFRLDIGAMYNIPPSESKLSAEYGPVYKELVFDIDMDKYDGVRQCCAGKMSCTRCWPLATTAVQSLHYLLVNVFAYRNVLWVYSGSKGFHCWVSDDAARYLTEKQRHQLCEYLWLGIGQMPDVDQNMVFAQLVRDVLAPFFFSRYAADHPVCAANAIILALSTGIPDDYPNRPIDASVQSNACDIAANLIKQACDWYNSRCMCAERAAIVRAIMRSVWPRIDGNVTTSLKHTLKTPFCVHPQTKRLCIPVDPATVHDFNPATVPLWTRTGCTDTATFKAALGRFVEYTNTL